MSTPRVAKYGDLRVGQCLAVGGYFGVEGGRLDHIDDDGNAWVKSDRAADFFITSANCEGGEVWILLDAPPVIVRREDYDALVALDKDWPDFAHAPIRTRGVIQDIIDNADTGGAS